MKHLSFIILSLFLLVACSKEETVKIAEDGQLICIFAELPKEDVSTRSQINIPVTHQLRCIIEVWNEEDALVYKKEKLMNGGEVSIPFEFALPSGSYECLIWADMISKEAAVESKISETISYDHYSDLYYDTSDLHKVTIKSDGTALMDTDLCDAFIAKVELKTNGESGQYSIKMERPFGKLIVMEKDAEKFNAMSNMNVSYTIPKSFNVSTDEPNDETLVVTKEKGFEDKNISQELFSSYIFTSSSAEGKAMETISFNFRMADGDQIERTIPKNSLFIKRNIQTKASGNLIEKNEVEIEPEVGHFFFKDGTWGSELTDTNKDNCVGIIYALGQQPGDNIDNYGQENEGKRIVGYVLSLDEIGVGDEYKEIVGSSHTSGRPHFYHNDLADASKFPAVKAGDIDWSSHNGYSETERYLVSDLYMSNPQMYLGLYMLTDWRKKEKAQNASDWYLPSISQLMTVIGNIYGYEEINSFEGHFTTATVNRNFKDALDSAVKKEIAKVLGHKKIVNITIGPKQNPIEVELTSEGTISSFRKDRTGWFAARIRPVLTILK